MPQPDRLARRAVFALAALVFAQPALSQSAAGSGPPRGPGAGGQPPAEVGVLTLDLTAVPYTIVLPGRAVAYEQTEIRPRVEGVIEEIVYSPGRDVKPGDVLFRLEADSYEAALEAAEAVRESAEAAVATAAAKVERDRKLAGVGSTQADLESSEAALAQARATLKNAEAQLKAAQLDLERVVIRSPIEGVAGLPEFSVGSLVTANQAAALTTVIRLDPIYVDVAESSARMLRVRERIASGDLVTGDSLQVALMLENGEVHSGEGRFVSPGAQVSPTTGTIDMRFEFDNPDRKILPGQFLRVTLTLGTSQALLVPQRATGRQADGSLTAFVVRDGKAVRVTLGYTGTWRNAWVVTSGIEPGESLIVDGLNGLREGASVSPVPVTIDASGVVRDLPAAAAPPGAGTPPAPPGN